VSKIVEAELAAQHPRLQNLHVVLTVIG